MLPGGDAAISSGAGTAASTAHDAPTLEPNATAKVVIPNEVYAKCSRVQDVQPIAWCYELNV